ncbi:viral A-type inclusion protein [Pseudoflavitalea sp. X16]|uniref:viral A-type inclusion protein n=1 Tax=Paraflavitalea devenefica TaxID=2716334 RepID=UPI001424778C|nr:viral A-type inclusion protein [Paraflavitalea devenefica]NII24243.1 viral A-type inclusion protein [Paraflavitalea devenefica]
MHNHIKSFVVIAAMAALACNNAPTDPARKDGFSTIPATKEDSLYHQVMEGHDVGMAKMGRIRKYLVQIQQTTDSISKLPVKQQDKQYLQALSTLQQELKKAEEEMNTWMEQFNGDSAKDNQALRMQYLEAEKEKVNGVKDQILGSLQRADSLLKPR